MHFSRLPDDFIMKVSIIDHDEDYTVYVQFRAKHIILALT